MAGTRIIEFIDGFTSNNAPTLAEASTPEVVGSKGSPTAIVAANGITKVSTTKGVEIQFIEGSGGAVDITANPQISNGTNIGEELILVGSSDSNTVQLDDGDGLSLNGGSIILALDSVITLYWNGIDWQEKSRRE